LVQRRTGYLPESRPLQTHRTRDTIIYFRDAEGWGAGARGQRADALLTELGLADVADRRIRRCQGHGAKGSVMTAIAHEPECSFRRAVSGLDPINQNELEAAIRRLAKGRQTILSRPTR